MVGSHLQFKIYSFLGLERYSDGGINDKCSIKRVDNIYNELVKGEWGWIWGVNISPL